VNPHDRKVGKQLKFSDKKDTHATPIIKQEARSFHVLEDPSNQYETRSFHVLNNTLIKHQQTASIQAAQIVLQAAGHAKKPAYVRRKGHGQGGEAHVHDQYIF
jgi:hypothetical protein